MPTTTHYERVFPQFDIDAFRLPATAPGDASGHVLVQAHVAGQDAIKPKGGTCPCCGQHVQVYRRSIYKRMASCLLWLVAEHRAQGGAWVRLKDGPIFHGGDNAKLRYWSLLVDRSEYEEDWEEEGWYKPSGIALKFCKRALRVPKYAYVYNGSVLGFSAERVGIEECLGNDFSLADLGIASWAAVGG